MNHKGYTFWIAICIVLSVFMGTAAATGSINFALAADNEPASDSPSPAPTPEPLPIGKQDLSFSELAPTTAMTFEELVGDNGIYSDENIGDLPPTPSSDTYKLVVDEYHQYATVYKKDANGNYTVPVRYAIVSSGSRSHPTVKGTFKMGDKYVRFGKFASYGVYGQYWRQITRGFFCHSLIYSSHTAKSYTSSYSALGTRASHGCVRMMVPDARWIFYNLGPGTVCEIIKGDKNDAAAAAVKKKLAFPKKPGTRPNLKPGEIPVTEAWPGWHGNAYGAYIEYIASAGSGNTQDGPDNGKA